MKRISPATVTFGVMAIVLGLVAAYVVRQSLQKPPVVEVPRSTAARRSAAQRVAVVFAKANLPKNARITADEVFVGFVGKEAKAATGTFRDTALAEGRITSQVIRAGQAIRDDYLLPIGEGLPDLAERLPAGHRAVTIQVQGAENRGKKLSEGDHIDLAMTVEGTHPDLGEVMTRTLLRNVLVVDANASRPLVRRAPKQPDPQPTMITVAVVPADANKLIVAERTGTLVATLVSLQDVDAPASEADDMITRRQLLGLKEVPQPKRFTVEKVVGGSVRVIEMSNDRIRESRDVSAGRRETIIEAPAPLDNKSASLPLPVGEARGEGIVPSGITLPSAAFVTEEAVR